MKVLVVDDSRNERKVIRYNFEWHGSQVIEAANGQKALEIAASEKPDLIISDCLMPVMDGFQFLYELKKLPDLKSIPVIFYSAVYTGSKEAELALSLGAQAFIEKPKNPDQLWEEVGRVMAAYAAGQGATVARGWRDEEFFRHYSQVVAGKLEEKVRELSAVNESLLRLNSDLERRVMERTAQLEGTNQELEMFCYAVSHDLRAPLRHLDGFSQAVLEDYGPKLNATGRDYLERISKSSRRMLEMMDALAELSAIARGKLVREDVDLSGLALEISRELAQSQPERRVDFRIADGLTVRGDGRLLREVLAQLLSNAWKFTAIKDEAVIEFYPTEWDKRLAFAVRDNGVGFDPEYADKLFAPFQKLHSGQDYQGRGIGLALVRRIVNRHGGWVKAEAAPGKGATFTVAL